MKVTPTLNPPPKKKNKKKHKKKTKKHPTRRDNWGAHLEFSQRYNESTIMPSHI